MRDNGLDTLGETESKGTPDQMYARTVSLRDTIPMALRIWVRHIAFIVHKWKNLQAIMFSGDIEITLDETKHQTLYNTITKTNRLTH